MADAQLWKRLTATAREAFGWAAAAETAEVGTRTLLIGLMRAEGPDSDADELLRAVGRSRAELFEALQEADRTVRIDLDVAAPRPLSGFPELTPNVEAVLARAAERSEPSLLGPGDLFAALLAQPDATAGEGLTSLLGRELALEDVSALYERHRSGFDGLPFGERVLDELLPGQARAWQRPVSTFSARGELEAMAFTPDGERLAGALQRGIELWRIASGEASGVLDAPGELTALAYGPASQLAMATHEGRVIVLERESAAPKEFEASDAQAPVAGLAFSPEGWLAAACVTGPTQVWSEDGRLQFAEGSDRRRMRAIAFPAQDRLVVLDVFGLMDSRRPGEAPSPIAPRDGLVSIEASTLIAAACSADGRRLAACYRRAVRVHDLESGAMQLIRHADDVPVTTVALSHDGTRLATCNEDGLVQVHALDVEPGSEPTPPAPSPGDRVEWLSDARATLDLLGRKPLASALAVRLERMRTSSPDDSFLVHVDGPWGSGKSSILRFLADELGERWLVVDFDAWRQSRVGPPWWALLTSLRRALRRESSWPRRAWLRTREAWRRLTRERLAVLPFALVFALAAGAFALTRPASGAVRDASALLTAVVGSVALLAGLGGTLASFVLWDSARGAKRLEQWQSDPMETLADHFAWLIGRVPVPVLFLVDELDRCTQDYVVALLESIQTLVRDAADAKQAPCFVVAADGRWLRASYEQAYTGFGAAVAEPGRPLGYLFLDKLFQLTLRVPEVRGDQQAEYLRRLLRGPEASPQAAAPEIEQATAQIARSTSQRQVLAAVQAAGPGRPEVTAAAVEKLAEPELERSAEHELERFAGLLERNPRSMKRFVNAYSMALTTLLLEGRSDVEQEPLALWTVLRLRWPALATHLREHPTGIDSLADGGALGAGDEQLEHLAGDPDVLEVVRFGERRLTGAAVAELTGARRSAYPA